MDFIWFFSYGILMELIWILYRFFLILLELIWILYVFFFCMEFMELIWILYVFFVSNFDFICSWNFDGIDMDSISFFCMEFMELYGIYGIWILYCFCMGF